MRTPRARRPHHPLPCLEELESRDVPSTAAALAFQADPAVTKTQVVGYAPAQIRHAYGFDHVGFITGLGANGAGAGQTVAIVDVYDDHNILSDANAFSAAFGLPQFNGGPGAPTFTKVNENGSASGPFPKANPYWDAEISLDVEWVHAVAPAANVVLVEANSTYLRDLLPAINTARDWPVVSVVSMSWGGAEFSGISADDAYLTTPAGHPGVTFTAATLDNGAYYHGLTAAYWPAVSPNALAVGGTVLTLDANGNYAGEAGWSQGGGGLSEYEAQPGYQSGVATQSATQRANPDVAYAAGGPGVAVYDTVSYNGQTGWFAAQGTSAGTPQWAVLVAIADQGRALQGLPALDGPSQVLPTLYGLYASPSYTTAFHDVTSGGNGYAAGPGYDLVTGLGTPQAGQVIQALINVPAAPANSPAAAPATSDGTASAALTAPQAVSLLGLAQAPDARPIPEQDTPTPAQTPLLVPTSAPLPATGNAVVGRDTRPAVAELLPPSAGENLNPQPDPAGNGSADTDGAGAPSLARQ